MDIISGAFENEKVRNTVQGGCSAGIGRLLSDNIYYAITIAIVLILIYYINADMLRAVPVLNYFVPDDQFMTMNHSPGKKTGRAA
jgi:hypothetical protein